MNNTIKAYDYINEEFKLYKDEMEKKVKILENIVEVEFYLNSIVSKSDFFKEVNNIIISALKIDYSTIYLIENDKYVAKVSNNKFSMKVLEEKYIYLYDGIDVSIFNMEYENSKNNITNSKSIMLIPLILGDRIIGYIFLEHSEKGYLIAVVIKNAELYRKLKLAAKIDYLTGLYNRDYFYNRVAKSSRDRKYYAIVMIDIDNFKSINDEYGHPVGDIVIKNISQIIMDNIRERDIAARYGGEEIILYIDNEQVNEEEIYNMIDDIRRKIANNSIIIEEDIIKVTASFGVSFSKSEDHIDDVIKEADRLLYKAKSIGKNRVIIH